MLAAVLCARRENKLSLFRLSVHVYTVLCLERGLQGVYTQPDAIYTCAMYTCITYLNIKPLHSVGFMLEHRVRCWPNIKPTLGERLVFDG